MGYAIRKGVAEGTWSREDLVITTKIFFGALDFTSKAGPNAQGLSRKHIIEGTKAALKTRPGVRGRALLPPSGTFHAHRGDCPSHELRHRPGLGLHWGTSMWTAAQISEACEIADRLGVRPIMEQPIYSVLDRNKVEFEYVDLYNRCNLGLTTWLPLAYGALTGKYSGGTPKGSRMENPMFKAISPEFAARVEKADKLKPVAQKLGISLVELALAGVSATKTCRPS